MKIKDIINYEFDKEKMSKYKSIKIIAYFLLAMLLLTFLSRFSDSLTIARITTDKVESNTINHDIVSEGILYSSNEKAIATVSEIIINSVDVSVGQSVNIGDTLFSLSMDSIEQAISTYQKTVDDKNKSVKRAEEDYNMAVTNQNNIINSARNDMDNAKIQLDNASLDEYEMLNQDYLSKKSIYESAVNDKEKVLTDSKRVLEDAQNVDVSRENDKLNKLISIKNDEGKIKADQKGIISKVNIEQGSVTSDMTAMCMSINGSQNKLTIEVDKNEQKYLTVGQKVNVELSNAFVDNATIESISQSKELQDMLSVVIQLPIGEGNVGESASVKISSESKKYQCCIPIEALHQDGNNYFIYVVSTKDTILGKEEIASKIDVKIEDMNGKYAGTDDLSIMYDQEIIISSNKNIENQDRVRRENN